MWKSLFELLKQDKIAFTFNERTNEVIVNRDVITFDFRHCVIELGFNLFECDNLFVIY